MLNEGAVLREGHAPLPRFLALSPEQGGQARPPTARIFLTRPLRVRQDAPFTQSSHVKHNLFDPEFFVWFLAME